MNIVDNGSLDPLDHFGCSKVWGRGLELWYELL